MPDDSRIVQGGELNLDGSGLEGVVVDAASRPAPGGVASPSTTATEFGSNYTLNDSVIKFLQNSINAQQIGTLDPTYIGGFTANNLIANDAIGAIVKSLGADFYTLGNFVLSGTGRPGNPYLTAELKLTPSIPKQSFQKGLTALLGGEETVKYLLSTDIAQALGLDDQTKPVDLNDSQLQQLFPDIAQIKSLNGNYVVPADPRILLLMVNPQYRRFLSACLDESKKVSGAPFNQVSGDYNTQKLANYGLSEWKLNQLIQTGFLGLPTIVKTGQQFGVKELKPYLDSLAKLREDLRNVGRL